MTNVDQFESIFRSAEKAPFHIAPPSVERALLVTDLPEYDADLLLGTTRAFTATLGPDVAWTVLTGDAFRTVTELLAAVETHRPDLICTYRHLHTDGWQHGFTLGDYTEVLTQATTDPVLVLPHPKRTSDGGAREWNTDSVMAITNHLTGDDQLVNWAAHVVDDHGTLHLTHIEDEVALERYLAAISRIPQIDTDVARRTLTSQLQKEPADFIKSCQAVLADVSPRLTVTPHVQLGHRLHDHLALIRENEVDLVVFNTKDEDQMAMHGLAYPLAVELRDIPTLML